MRTNTMALTIKRLPGVQADTGLSKSTIYAAIKAGTFPAPVRLSPHVVGWISDEIDTWISARIRESRPATAATV